MLKDDTRNLMLENDVRKDAQSDIQNFLFENDTQK